MLKKLSSVIFLLIICGNAFGATQLKKTVCPSGCDYTSLESAMNANEQDLVTADKYFDVEISGTWSSADTTAVTIHNYTTDATHYINIYTTGNARHSGVWSTSKYYLSASASNGLIQNSVLFVIVDGLQLIDTDTSSTYASSWRDSSSTGGLLILKNNIFRGGRRTTRFDGSNNVYFINNTVYGSGLTGITENQTGGTFYIYNSTVIGNSEGITCANSSQSINVKNTYAKGTTAFYAQAGSIIQTTNASSDTTATGTALDNIAYSTANFTNVTAGSEDLSLTATSALKDVGTDLGSPYNVDIIGTSRPQGSAWDIGAVEYVSSTPTAYGSVLNDSVWNDAYFQ